MTIKPLMRTCWCGSLSSENFCEDYSKCAECGTLVSQQGLSHEQLLVQNDDTDFYGKKYWLEHQAEDLGFPDIHTRARNDLAERNLHWLKTLLKYRLPPAKVLEIGCSHGSFVALMRQAGYDASGVEMSPWVVDFGKKTFNIPISIGPVEALQLPPGSFDVIVLMDVLEHLLDPVATMAHCLKLLKPDGLLIIQTPQFKAGMNYPNLVETNGAFLEQLKVDEHLYLFSDRSATLLFQQLDAKYVQFEPAIFSHYDMFFVVSRVPLVVHSQQDCEQSLLETPNGRMVQALLDVRARENQFAAQFAASECDRAARWEQIETLERLLKDSEADRAARWGQIETLGRLLKDAEADRIALQETIRSLLSRPIFRYASRVFRWPEVTTLSELLPKKDER